MSPSGLAITILFFCAAALGAVIMLLSSFIGKRKAPAARKLPYECGIDPVGSPHHRISVKYFLIAVLFIIFDVEIVFFYPWALAFHRGAKGPDGPMLVAELFIFMLILLVALVYAWGKGALEWED